MGEFLLTKEQIMVRQLVHDIAEEQIRPMAAEIDENEVFPEETIKILARAGVLGCAYPEELGGSGMDFLSFILAMEEIAKVCGSTASIVSTHAGVSMYCIELFGTKEQKERYMPLMAQGHLMGFALTEANAGSDSSGMITTAVKDGDHYIVNGAKMFISSAPANEFNIVITVTGRDERNRPKYTAFIIDRDTAGFSVGKHIHKLGIRGSLTAELIFEDCVVPKSQMLGREGEGMKVALASLNAGRISMGAQALGIAQGAINETIKYVNERVQFRKRIAQFQNTQFTLADLQTRVDAGRLLLWRAAKLKDEGEDFGKEAAMAKLYNSDLAMETTTKCLQFFGGYGYTKEYPIERMMRDAKITQIYEGTNEIQKMVIGRAIGVA